MEYFKNGLKTVLGTSQPGSTPTGAETVSDVNPPRYLAIKIPNL